MNERDERWEWSEKSEENAHRRRSEMKRERLKSVLKDLEEERGKEVEDKK